MRTSLACRLRLAVGLGLTLALASGIMAVAEEPANARPSPASASDSLTRDALDAGRGWTSVVHSEQGPGETWIEYGLGGMVAVLQPDDGAAEAWRSDDGIAWTPVALPADLGTISEVVSLRGDLALITDDVRAADVWSFDVWTTDDGADWRLVSSPMLEAHPDLLDQSRTFLGLRSVEGGFMAFESYAPMRRVFVWRSPDGETWERREVEGLGGEVIGAGSRILEGDRQQLYVVQPGFPPHLLISANGTTWEDAGALVHGLRDPEGAAAIATTRDGLLVVGREDDAGPGAMALAVYRGAPDEHWVHTSTLPGAEEANLLVDRNVAIVAGTATGSGDVSGAHPTHSFMSTSSDRGRTWQQQPTMAEADLCLGPVMSIGDVALLGSGCAPSGEMSILAARLDSFGTATEPPIVTSIPSAPKALQCDFKRSRQDSGRGIYGEGERGFAKPEDAMRAFIREGWVIPQSGYRELARDDTAVLYGYKYKGEVKVAVRVVAMRGVDDDWVADRLSTCRIFEFGTKADMGPGVWLWANRWGRTIQERRGPAHCDWQSSRFLYWEPPGTRETLRATKLYLRDPKGIFRDQWAMPYLRSTTLPSDARYTGYRRDGAALWLAADERAMYVKDGAKVERWPRAPSGIGCA